MSAPDPVAALSRALLYEGLTLYPYRASSLKNRAPLFFGGLWPRAWAARGSGDADTLAAQALIEGEHPAVSAEVRFLQLTAQGAVERRVAAAEGITRFAFAPHLDGEVELRRHGAQLDLVIRNTSDLAPDTRDAALAATMASVHAVLTIRDGAWHSVVEPPPALADQARLLEQQGLYPVLFGEPGARDTLLVAPIILGDYPQVAPQSPGDFFDGTEIDEMLMLRVQTLSDAEREELARAQPHVRRMLERVEALTPDQMSALHGALRDRRALPGLTRGARVRLKPARGGDVMDLALAGRAATVTAVEHDVDGGVHLAVVLDDDPGADLGEQGFHGHRFFFRAAEVELL